MFAYLYLTVWTQARWDNESRTTVLYAIFRKTKVSTGNHKASLRESKQGTSHKGINLELTSLQRGGVKETKCNKTCDCVKRSELVSVEQILKNEAHYLKRYVDANKTMIKLPHQVLQDFQRQTYVDMHNIRLAPLTAVWYALHKSRNKVFSKDCTAKQTLH